MIFKVTTLIFGYHTKMSFRDNLRETLDFLGMEQKELAAKTGLSLKTIENYVKKDSSVPAADKAVLIAQALGVTVEYLISGKKPKKPDTPAIQPKTKEAVDTISKLNKYNYEVIVSVAKTLLNLQTKNKPRIPNDD
jgi:transcriptional regulator with XRE-family HTH domain